ncbi:MFS transporter, MHS family, proline/betaine transporter [Paramicrobacterium humi]|uniref:Putative proline/betaine transporter n=1 Tax=Paramicrobacterium humi TaxID=640635 RepID=A0A1H4KSY9_9MICO|nr:MFS transporter [Microbacterium humi]SEB61513.1 MFS transporter, MHS family, proline/betaine transporter [Microbacterium humi]
MPTDSQAALRSDTELLDLPRRDRTRRLAAVGIGNFMEWFDFAIYGYFTAIIGAQFFPANDPSAATLSGLAVFAVGFISRPVGALFLGPLGDRLGRKTVLVLTVLSMGIVTTLIGLTPSYETIGIAAPIIVVALRLVQGMMVGGEWTSAAAYIGESAPKSKRALFASVVTATAGLAFLVGTLVAALLTAVMDETALATWGWRIPFVFSLVMAVVAVWIRLKLEDTPVYQELERKRETGTIEVTPAGQKGRAFLMTLAFSGIFGVGLYYFVTYANNHLTGPVEMERLPALLATGAAMVVYVAFNPLVGVWSDRVGRRPVLYTGIVGLIVWPLPAFMLMNTGNPFFAFLALVVFSFFVACCAVMNNVLLVEVFPASIRSAGSAIGYNVAYALLAGPGPLIAAALVAGTGMLTSPAFYVIAVAVVALVILAPLLKETRHADISHG